MADQLHADSLRHRVIAEVRKRRLLAEFVAEEQRLRAAGERVIEDACREAEQRTRRWRWSEWVI
jgi:hypothetical protein